MGADVICKPPALHGRGALAKHSLQLVGEKTYRAMGVSGGDPRLQIITPDLDMPLGGEAPGCAPAIEFDIDAQPENPGFMAE